MVLKVLLLIGHLETATYRSSRMQWRILGNMVHCGAQGIATCRSSRMQWRILGDLVHCGAQGIATYRSSRYCNL